MSDVSPPSWSLKDFPPSAGGALSVEPISEQELAHLAQLSHLALPKESAKRQQVLNDVESVVEWVGAISALPMDHFEPLYTPLEVPAYYTAAEQRGTQAAEEEPAHLADTSKPEALRLRVDTVADGGLDKALMANASFKHRGFFVVPKVVDLEDS